jgi:hypothetical protein
MTRQAIRIGTPPFRAKFKHISKLQVEKLRFLDHLVFCTTEPVFVFATTVMFSQNNVDNAPQISKLDIYKNSI